MDPINEAYKQTLYELKVTAWKTLKVGDNVKIGKHHLTVDKINPRHPDGYAINWKHNIKNFKYDFLYTFNGEFYGVTADWKGNSSMEKINLGKI